MMQKKQSIKQNAKNIMLAHSKAKVDFYQAYLTRYLSIMSVSKYFNTINIFDVFCGRGEYEDGGIGSPIRAIQTIMDIKQARPYDSLCINLFLNDAEKEYIERVRQYVEEHLPDHKLYCNVHYYNCKANELFVKICKFVSQTNANARNFIFVDPYGYKDINRNTLVNMMSNGKTEILLFLPISFMHRFRSYAFHTDANKGAQRLKEFISEFFPPTHPVCLEEEMDVLEYIDALTEAFSFNNQYYTTNYFIERDAHNYFALFFIGNNLLGLQKAVETKWALDAEFGRGFRQSEKQNTQTRLFDEWFEKENENKLLNALKDKLLGYLSSKERSNAELYEYILRIGYTPTHANNVLRDLQINDRICVNRCDNKNVRRGCFYLSYQDAKDKSLPKAIIKLKHEDY